MVFHARSIVLGHVWRRKDFQGGENDSHPGLIFAACLALTWQSFFLLTMALPDLSSEMISPMRIGADAVVSWPES